MIAFRTDANHNIATGHAMRCMSIATQLRNKDNEVLFIVSDRISAEFIRPQGFQVLDLDTTWGDKNPEIEIMCDVLRNHDATILLVDSYEITDQYLARLMSTTPVVYFDDLCVCAYPVYAIINYSMGLDKQRLDYLYKGTQTKTLLGSMFAPLRDEFSNITPIIRPVVRNVLVTTGGGDRFGLAQKIVEYIMKDSDFSDIKFHIVSGAFAEGNHPIWEREHVAIHQNVSHMAELMRSCDLAISAGGTTLFELCACGVPTISIAFAENQIPNAQGFDQCGIIPYVGDVRLEFNDNLACIKRYLLDLTFCVRRRNEASKRMRACVDGKGASRIADFLIQASTGKS